MKKYIFIFILIGLTSCSNEIKKVENPKKETTFEILEFERDTTVEVAMNGYTVYLLNKETKLVEYKVLQIDNRFILFVMICSIFIGIIIGYSINE